MSIVIKYTGEELSPIGLRYPKLDEFVLDPLLSETSFSVEYEFNPSLKNIEVRAINFKDVRDDGFHDHYVHLYFESTNPLAHREPLPLEIELWATLVWQSEKIYQSIFELEITNKAPKEMRLGEMGIGMIHEDFYFELNTPIRADYTFELLEKHARELDERTSILWEKVIRLTNGVFPPPSQAKHRDEPSVFMCHSTKDKVFVRKLREELKKRNIKVWLDEEQILVGHDFVDKMEEGIAAADFTIVVLSPRFIEDGPWAKEEYKTALAKQVSKKLTILLPVLYERCELPNVLRTKKYADFRESFENGIETLTDSIVTLKKDSIKK